MRHMGTAARAKHASLIADPTWQWCRTSSVHASARACGSEHRTGLRMFYRMKSELLLFVTLEPCFAAVRPTVPMRHHQDALGVMEMARRGNLSKQEGAVACLLWRVKNFPAAGHRDDINILKSHMPDKGVKDMPETSVEAAEHKGGCLIRPRQIAGIEKDRC